MVDELDALGCDTPVLPGIIPVINPTTIRRFANMNAAAVDEDLWARLEAADDDDRLSIAIEHGATMATSLLEAGAPGLHFYALNRADAVGGVLDLIGW
jgi:methylenetetrahydrofolate reductase (NADPH)